MSWIIDYVRSCFCKHEWEIVDRVKVLENSEDSMPVGKKWTVYCKKCGSFKTYYNYER